MKRNIKFRALGMSGIKDGFWCYGLYSGPRKIHEKGISCYVNDITIGQFTGTKDKHGKDIYEYDIVKGNNNRYMVFYNEDRAMFALDPITDNVCNKITYPFDEWDLFEIIGNVFENPELL
jgi:uncharacterized phage protein (TIGR01671 family)